MLTEKKHISWSIVAVIIAISVVYFHVTTALLRSSSDNVAFTSRELKGIDDYAELLTQYFLLYNEDAAEKVASPISKIEQAKKSRQMREKILHIGDDSNLILDPSLESYYLVNILFEYVPRLLVCVVYKQQRECDFDGLEYALKVVADNGGGEEIKYINKHVFKLKEQIFNAKDSLKEVRAIYDLSLKRLRHVLQVRLSEQKQRMGASVAIVTVLYCALTLAVVAAIRNYVSRREIELVRERQALTERLAEKNRELERFTYAAAHDLREPVRTICCFSTLLKNEAGEALGEAVTEYAEIIERTSRRAEQMVSDLLVYATLSEEARLVGDCDCTKEIASVLEDMKPLIDEVSPKIDVGEMPVIHAVSSLFRRVIMNLVENAIKYRKKDVPLHIEIYSREVEDGWVFLVSDNGIGIDAAHLESVFEPFRRLYPHEYIEGQGLGLTSCKKIIEMLGGKIWIDSKLGGGTSVRFFIPQEIG